MEEPSVEEPSVEEPSVEEPSVEEPSVEEPSVEEPSVEEPSVEEPSVEEPSVEEPLQVLFLYSGVVNDGGWTQAFDQARQQLEETFGGQVETTFKESLWGQEVIASVIDNGILDGADVLVGTSFEQGEPMLAAAAANPDVYFIVSQWDNPGDLNNFAGYINAPEDGAYIQGIVAGHLLEQGGTVGWVDAFPVPYDLRLMNGFALGLRHSNPDATMRAVFTNDWVDTTLFGRATRSLVDGGVGFVATSIGTASIGEIAEEARVPFAGVQIDASRYAPEMTITTSEYTWAPLLEGHIRTILEGRDFDTSFTYRGMSDGVVTLTDWGPLYDQLSNEAKADVEAEFARISSNPRSVFIGPIVDANGETVVADGESLDIADLRSMAWVMSNIEGLEL